MTSTPKRSDVVPRTSFTYGDVYRILDFLEKKANGSRIDQNRGNFFFAYQVIEHYLKSVQDSETLYQSGLDVGRDLGRTEGRQETQRFFRLALGVEMPTEEERALWNNPTPLKTEET